MKKPILIITFLLGLIVVLSILKVVVYNRLSTSGVFVGEIEEQISFYKTQNALLSEKLLISSSLTNIVEIAEKEGFTNEKKSFMILTSKPLAVRQ